MAVEAFTTQLLAEYTGIFDDEPRPISAYLTGISRETLLNATTFLLGLANRNSEFDDPLKLISIFFCAENNDFANDLFERIKMLSAKTRAAVKIIAPLTALQLFEFGFEQLNENQTQSKTEIEVNLFKAIVAQNEVNTAKQQLAYESTAILPMPGRILLLHLAQSLPYSELVNYDIHEVWACQLIKSIYLFEFLEAQNSTQPLLKTFLAYFKADDWKSFLKMLIPLSLPVLKKDREAHTDIVVAKGAGFDESVAFIDKMTVRDDEVLADYDFRKIRSRPFFKAGDGIYRIIFDLFAAEILHKGIYFKLSDVNNSLKSAEKIKNIRSFYTDEFSERYLLYQMLEHIWGQGNITFTGTEIKETGLDAEPDYYIRQSEEIFLFESKDILINAEIKSVYDFNRQEAEFKKKLYYEEKEGHKSNKAVLQLLKNVERALKMAFTFDQDYDPEIVAIYPIVVLHDHMYKVPGLNYMINEWFQTELRHLGQQGLYIDRVRPLTIIDMDSFIYNQDAFRKKEITLGELISGYHQFVHLPRRKLDGDIREATQMLNNKSVGFPTFLVRELMARKIYKAPEMIKDKGYNLF